MRKLLKHYYIIMVMSLFVHVRIQIYEILLWMSCTKICTNENYLAILYIVHNT